jgi:hypothetical protein
MNAKIAFKRDKMNKKYSVIVRGENFILKIDGKTNTYGFVTTRNVRAFSVDDARDLAISLVENDYDLQILMDDKQSHVKPPTLYVEEMYHLSWWEKLGGKGFTFFIEETTSQE